jgi:hypothetical protein
MYYRYVDWLWREGLTQSSIADCLVPAAAEECIASHVNGAFCGTEPDQRGERLRNAAETNAGSSAPVESPPPMIQNVLEHYTALLSAFPSREEFRVSASEPESETDVTAGKE